MTTTASNGSDIYLVAVTDGPDRHRLSHRAVGTDCRDMHFFCLPDLIELIPRPLRHRRAPHVPIRTSDLIARRSSIVAVRAPGFLMRRQCNHSWDIDQRGVSTGSAGVAQL